MNLYKQLQKIAAKDGDKPYIQADILEGLLHDVASGPSYWFDVIEDLITTYPIDELIGSFTKEDTRFRGTAGDFIADFSRIIKNDIETYVRSFNLPPLGEKMLSYITYDINYDTLARDLFFLWEDKISERFPKQKAAGAHNMRKKANNSDFHPDMDVYVASAWWEFNDPFYYVVADDPETVEDEIMEAMKDEADEAVEQEFMSTDDPDSLDEDVLYEKAMDKLMWSGVHKEKLSDVVDEDEMETALEDLELSNGVYYPQAY